MKKLLYSLLALSMIAACQPKETSTENPKQFIGKETVDMLVKEIGANLLPAEQARLAKGVQQCASLWNETDGNTETFKTFVKEYFISDSTELKNTFLQLSDNFESLLGCFNKIGVDLKLKLQVDKGEINKVDEIFGAYDVSAHFNDDMFANKIAFVILLNFPAYTLQEKTELGNSWSRLQWAYARIGDMFGSRIPAQINQQISEVFSAGDNYISNYNICMDQLRNDNNEQLFPDGMKLISHWGLRDEIKSNYALGEKGFEKQRMIYEVMQRIITQSIPEQVINNNAFTWNPFNNKIWENGKEIPVKAEPHARYQTLLNCFKAVQKADAYSPQAPTYIERKFSQEMEIPVQDVEKLFTEFVSHPLMKEVGHLIAQRIGRDLHPWDIWYDGFKPRSTINEEDLNKITSKKYPSAEVFQADLPNILVKLGWTKDSAVSICNKIKVDPSRGAGHAWGAAMRGDKARLRTRIDANGMNYKGYNIAVHEFGHNVEQTISLYDMDYYMLQGVPNTAFTEALAFIFQARDLELLGIKNEDKQKEYFNTLDKVWACYEIMGVSLVDIHVWKWLYANPNATAEQLEEQTVKTAKEVWNQYYAPILGSKDSPILAIYSHMIDYPLYLSAYPIGHLIDFQVDSYLRGKNMANEVYRMFTYGRVIPQQWMKHAVGEEISTKSILSAAQEALEKLKK